MARAEARCYILRRAALELDISSEQAGMHGWIGYSSHDASSSHNQELGFLITLFDVAIVVLHLLEHSERALSPSSPPSRDNTRLHVPCVFLPSHVVTTVAGVPLGL